MSNCPFNREECNADCELFIKPEDLNELVVNRLSSIGVFNRDRGMCAFKNMALGISRYMFENTGSSSFR